VRVTSGEPGYASLADTTEVNSAVADEVVKAYYPTVVASGDSARTRAQTAYTIASAVATAIVAAGIFGGIDDATCAVKLLGVAALAAWLAAAALFMFAVAGRIDPPVTGDQPDASAFVRAVVGNAKFERSKIGERSANALRMSLVAMAITLVAVIVAWMEPTSSRAVDGTVALSPAGVAHVALLCGARPPNPMAGSFDPSSLTDEIVAIDVDASWCGNAKRTLRIRKVAIRGTIAAKD
jgi:hypothetical protein